MKKESTPFQSNQPFPHIVLDGLFDEILCRRLVEEFPRFDPKYALNENGKVGQKATREDLTQLGSAYRELDQLLKSEEFLNNISQITRIKNLLYDPDYVGGGTHENLSGQDLDQHIDFNYHPRYGWYRRLNIILYLNEGWNPEWGGLLELHENPWTRNGQVQRIVPAFNRTVIFETSERSWHGFDKIQNLSDGSQISRKSIALYLYTLDQPENILNPEHSTVYVNAPLPSHLKAGHVLTEADVEQIEVLVTRREHHLQRLYKREIDFNTTITSLRADSFKKLGAESIQGAARLIPGGKGFYQDGWLAPESTMKVKTIDDVDHVIISGRLPKLGPGPFELSVRYLHTEFRRQLKPESFDWLIPLRLPKDQTCEIHFHSLKSWIPAENIGGSDSRSLSFILKSVTFYAKGDGVNF